MLRSKLAKYRAKPILPRHCIEPPRGQLYSRTHYRKDYQEYDLSLAQKCKAQPIWPKPCIDAPEGHFCDMTTYVKAFSRWLTIMEKVCPILPRHCIDPPAGVMESQTTYLNHYKTKSRKHHAEPIYPRDGMSPPHGQFYSDTHYNNDFHSKPMHKVPPILPRPGIDAPSGQIYSRTTYQKNYNDGGRKKARVKPIYPRHNLKLPKGYQEYYTTYKRAFNQWLSILDKAYPHKPKHNIDPPEGQFYSDTNYADDFQGPLQSYKVQPIIPPEGMSPPHGHMFSDTVYNTDYDLEQQISNKEIEIIDQECKSPPNEKSTNAVYKADYQSNDLPQETEPMNALENVSHPHGNLQNNVTNDTTAENGISAKEYKSSTQGSIENSPVYARDFHVDIIECGEENPQRRKTQQDQIDPNCKICNNHDKFAAKGDSFPNLDMALPWGQSQTNPLYKKYFRDFTHQSTTNFIPPHQELINSPKSSSRPSYAKTYIKYTQPKTRRPVKQKEIPRPSKNVGNKRQHREGGTKATPIYPRPSIPRQKGYFQSDTTYKKSFNGCYGFRQFY